VCEYNCNSYIFIHVSIHTAPAADAKKTAASTSAAARAAAGGADDAAEAAADFLSKDVNMMKAGELKAGVNVCVYVYERREVGATNRAGGGGGGGGGGGIIHRIMAFIYIERERDKQRYT